MTDRGQDALRTTPNTLEIGPSQMHWNGRALIINVDEVGSLPKVGRLRGQIIVTPQSVTDVELALTPDGAHIWRPFAPLADIEVRLDGRHGHWNGKGYFDANFGTRALETDFDAWTWGCFPTKTGATVAYDVHHRDGGTDEMAIRFGPGGEAAMTTAPPRTRFRRSLWAVERHTRADSATRPRQVLGMLDAPFYCRSAVETTLDGERTTGIHEALDLRRFRSPWLKPMLAMRVPRRRKWSFD